MKQIHTLTVNGNAYEIMDEAARQQIAKVNNAVFTSKNINDWQAISFESGYIGVLDGAITANSNFKSSEEIAVTPGDTIRYYLMGYTSIATIAAYDADHAYLKGKSVYGLSEEMHEGTYIVPDSVKYIRICRWATSKGNADTVSITLEKTIAEDFNKRMGEINAHISSIRTKEIDDSFIKNVNKLTGINYENFLTKINRSQNVTDDGYTITIPVGAYAYYHFNAFELGLTNFIVRFRLKSGNLNYTKVRIGPSFNVGTNSACVNDNGDCVCEINAVNPENPYATFRFDNTAGTVTEPLIIEALTIEKSGEIYCEPISNIGLTMYVGTNGSDSNSGTNASPLKTVNAALRKGATSVKVFGGTYEQQIDLSLLNGSRFSMSSADTTSRVIFVDPDSFVADSESKVEGYTHVYSAAVAGTVSDSDVYWIYQDGVADAKTLITDAERHPLERGLTYRCEDTKIIKCAADNLNDALNEIDTDNNYKWYIDNGTVYYSRPSAVNAANPLRAGKRNKLFTSTKGRACTIEMAGIESKYMAININSTVASKLIDCKATNVCDTGAIIFDSALGATLIRCEAANNRYGSIGDGFNASSSNAGDAKTRQNTCMMIDCWSHDNYDDGYSDHERAEMTVHGGLFEYNGKAGVTPSYGSHCTCYHVIARHNKNGFMYVGAPEVAEGGKYGQLLCFGCIADSNNAGNSTNAGFAITGSGNRAYLVDCKTLHNQCGFYAESGTTIVLTNCYAHGNETLKTGTGTIEVKNAELIESV